jgi:DNA polymerase III delta prime subunit
MTTTQVSPVIGHERKWRALQRAFARGQVPQTLLISGPAQVGKWTLARRFTQLLLCPNVPQPPQEIGDQSTLPAPCGTCRTCHQIEIETFPDFRVFRPIVSEAKDEKDWITAPSALEGSVITIEVARRFGDEAMRRPSIGARKVMIIEQAERMTISAQNALLKTFEEPVQGLTIIFLSDNPNQLLPTVLSRCWHLPLGLVPDAEIANWLREIYPQADDEQREQAVHIAVGRPGAAWRELKRLEIAAQSTLDEEQSTLRGPRFAQAQAMVERIARSQPVAALALTEETLKLAKVWWAQDQEVEPPRGAPSELKKADAKIARSSVARFLDELSNAYRVRWRQSLGAQGNAEQTWLWSDGLDQIRKTRHYILRNANTNLALDVLFGRLIAAQLEVRKDKARGNLRMI